MSDIGKVSTLELGPLRAVLGSLDGEFGSYSDEELCTLRGAALAQEAVRAGAGIGAMDDATAQAWCEKISAAVNRAPPVVARPDLVRTIVNAVAKHPAVAVIGAAGSGKTMVLQRLLPDYDYARAVLPRIIRIDCAALRMADPRQFATNATWAIFGSDKEAFFRFIFECRRQERNPLLTLLEHRLAGGGLVVMDHMEHVNRSDGIGNFLFGELLLRAEYAGFRVVFCDRLMTSLRKFRRFAEWDIGEVIVDNFSREELADWLKMPFFRGLKSSSLTPAEVEEVTGGSPRLVRDFANFIQMDQHADLRTLEKFRKCRPKEYVAHCERLIWAKRTLPSLLTRDFEQLKVDELPKKERRHVSDTLCTTGVVSKTAEGMFAYVSPIHRDRANFLMRPEVFSLALLRATSPEALDSRSYSVRLRDCAEIAVDPLTLFLAGERSARLALQKLRAVLHNWGFIATLYLRDRDNAGVFLELAQNGDRLFRLDDDDDFVRAVQTGRSLVAGATANSAGELIVPVVGYTGTVEMLFKGSFCSRDATRYLRDIRRDRFVNLLRGLKPTLSQVLERFWASRDRLVSEKLMYTTKTVSTRSLVWQSLLQAFSSKQPAALVVLHKPQKRWKVLSFERVGRSEGEDAVIFANDAWAEPADSRRLDAIAVHPSEHGLVLSNQEATSIFPLLAQHKTAAVYVRPVRFHTDRRLVVFMFKRAPAGGLDGKVQQRLWLAAPAIAANS